MPAGTNGNGCAVLRLKLTAKLAIASVNHCHPSVVPYRATSLILTNTSEPNASNDWHHAILNIASDDIGSGRLHYIASVLKLNGYITTANIFLNCDIL